MASIKAKVDFTRFARNVEGLQHNVDKKMREALTESMNALKRFAKSEHDFKDRTGSLRRAIRYRTNRAKMEGTLYIDDSIAPYGVFVHEPTGTHAGKSKYLILPHPPNKYLRWVDEATGKKVRAREVWHPGSAADPFIERAASENARSIREIFARKLAAATRGF